MTKIIDKINAYFDAEIEEDRDLDEVYNQLEDAENLLKEAKDFIHANL